MFRPILAAFAITLAPVAAKAQVFTDLVVGVGIPGDIETEQFVVDDGIDVFSGTVAGNTEIGVSAGFEVGYRGFLSPNVSASVSYDYFETSLDSITLEGTLNGQPVSETSDLSTIIIGGVDINAQFHTALANLRYDFVGPRERVQPFVSIGAGAAFVSNSDAHFAMGATAGVRVPVGERAYTGARYRYLRVFDYNDSFIRFNDVNAHVLSLILGAHI